MRRVQDGTFLDIELTDDPYELVKIIESHYRSDNDPIKQTELLRLQRFARLAAKGLAIEDRARGAHDIYAGELMALDQGCRIIGGYIFPSTEIQRFTQNVLKDVIDPLNSVGRLDEELNPIPVPTNAAYLQELRTEQWGTGVYEQATLPVKADGVNLDPIHETIIRLTGGFKAERAESMKVGFWLVMRHLIEPAQLAPIYLHHSVPGATTQEDEDDDTLSAATLSEMHPEMHDIPLNTTDIYYASMDELRTFFAYKYLRLKSAYPLTEDRLTIKGQQATLELEANKLLENTIELPPASAMQVSGEFLYYSLNNKGTQEVWLMPEKDSNYLRGEFAGITVKRAHTQAALTQYASSADADLPDTYDYLMPHIRLTNAMLVNLDKSEGSIETVFDKPVDVPIFYKNVHFSKLTDIPPLEP